jgi:hypothetical protein
MKRVIISDEPISAEVALSGLSDLGGGAVSSFTGISRDDGGVTAIELEHYPGMTESSLMRLIDEAFARFEVMERRADLAEGRADALGLGGPARSLADEFAELSADDDVNAELAAMKARLGKSEG